MYFCVMFSYFFKVDFSYILGLNISNISFASFTFFRSSQIDKLGICPFGKLELKIQEAGVESSLKEDKDKRTPMHFGSPKIS